MTHSLPNSRRRALRLESAALSAEVREPDPILVVVDQPSLARDLRKAVAQRGIALAAVPPRRAGRLRVTAGPSAHEDALLPLLEALEEWVRHRPRTAVTVRAGPHSFRLSSTR